MDKFNYTPKRPAIISYQVDIWDIQDLTSGEKFLYMALMRFASSKDSTCFPSNALLSRMVMTSERTVINNINGLIKKGYLLKEKRFDEKGSQTTNLYTLIDYYEKLPYKEEQKKVLADNHEDKDKQNTNNNSITNDFNTEVKPSQEKVNPIDENICKVREIVKEPLLDGEIQTILKTANNDLEVIKAKYEVVKNTKDIKSIGALIVKAIKEDWQATQDTTTTSTASNCPNKAVSTYKANKNTNHAPKTSYNRFNAFPQRSYTQEYYSNLEQALLNK